MRSCYDFRTLKSPRALHYEVEYCVFSSAMIIIKCLFGNKVLVSKILLTHFTNRSIAADLMDSSPHVVAHFTRICFTVFFAGRGFETHRRHCMVSLSKTH